MKNSTVFDLSRAGIVPYFMWDYRYTVGQIKEILSGENESQRIWRMAKILRDARYSDVWKFISRQDFLKYRQQLLPRLGRQKGFWQFLYSRWKQYGIVKDDGSTR